MSVASQKRRRWSRRLLTVCATTLEGDPMVICKCNRLRPHHVGHGYPGKRELVSPRFREALSRAIGRI